MPRRLPNLNQLRAFEATARHLSFKDAADELFVTQAAISHQVKALEEDFGRQLFIRSGRDVSLTEEAVKFVAQITPALDQIAQATATLKSSGISGELRLSMNGFLGGRIVTPFLPEFKALYPDLEVKIDYSREYVDVCAGHVDAALRYGRGPWEGLVSATICNRYLPMSLPSLVDGMELPLSAEEIAQLPLATTPGHNTGWLEWFQAAGIEDTSGLNFVEFADAGLAMDYMTSGRAVALLNAEPLAEHELTTGAVQIISPLAVSPKNAGIHIVYPEALGPNANVLAFVDWLKTVVARLRAKL